MFCFTYNHGLASCVCADFCAFHRSVGCEWLRVSDDLSARWWSHPTFNASPSATGAFAADWLTDWLVDWLIGTVCRRRCGRPHRCWCSGITWSPSCFGAPRVQDTPHDFIFCCNVTLQFHDFRSCKVAFVHYYYYDYDYYASRRHAVCVRVYIRRAMQAALVSAAKVMRCIQWSLVVSA